MTGGRSLAPSGPWDGFKGKQPTSNIEHRTSNGTECSVGDVGFQPLEVGRWMFDVQCFVRVLLGEGWVPGGPRGLQNRCRLVQRVEGCSIRTLSASSIS